MGGGSSDAASTIVALNKLWKLNLNEEEIVEVENSNEINVSTDRVVEQ